MGAGDSFLTAFLLSYRTWQLTAADPTADERRAAAENGLDQASRFAARICMLDGSSGHPLPYPAPQN